MFPLVAQLPYELKLDIIDRITVPSDLRALCLTSKSWRAAAAPRLFAHVKLKMHERPDVHNLLRAAAQGAPLHATKSLDLIYEPQSDRLDLDFDAQIFSIPERDRGIDAILCCIPKDKLTTFRLITGASEKHALSYRLIARLLSSQSSLKHLNIHIPSHDPEPRLMAQIAEVADFLHLDTLHVECRGHRGRHWFMGCLLERSPNLRRLGLGGGNASIPRALDVISDGLSSSLPKQSIQEIVIQREWLHGQSFYQIGMIIDFTCLKRMILWQCVDEPVDFLCQLVAALKGKISPMEHFALDTSNCGTRPFRIIPLRELYGSFPRLKSLHLGEYGAGPTILLTLATCLDLLGKTIEVLSVHDHCLAASLSLEEIAILCRGLPSLRQLGLQIDDSWLGVSLRARRYIEALMSLKHLRVLHLRHPFAQCDYPSNESCCLPQRLADLVFYRLENLQVLVITRQQSETGNASNVNNNVRRMVYVRDHEREARHRKLPRTAAKRLAKPVSMEWLRHNESDFEVVYYDPLTPWHGGWPGWLDEE